MRLGRRTVLAAAAAAPLHVDGVVRFAAPDDDDRWNGCIAWAGERMRMLHGVRVRHVPGSAADADLVSVSGGQPGGWPWRIRGWVCVHDPARGVTPPVRLAEVAAWRAAHPGRLAPGVPLAEARARFAAGAADLYLAHNPGEAACGIARGVLPVGTQAVPLLDAPAAADVLVLHRGAAPAARLFARFLLSAEAQAHFADPWYCGSPISGPPWLDQLTG